MLYKHNSPSQKKSRKIYLVPVLLVCLAIGLTSFFLWKNYSEDKSKAQQKINDEAQTESAKNTAVTETPLEQKTNPSGADTKQDIPQADANIVINSVSQSNGQVSSSATLSSGNGDCIFTYTIDQDKPVTRRTSSVNSICTSSAPEVEFSRLGEWSLNVTAYMGGKKTEANKSVTIN